MKEIGHCLEVMIIVKIETIMPTGTQVVYDDMKTVSFSGDLKASFSDDVTFGISGTFSSYTNDVEKEAWNLPTIKKLFYRF
jgi:hypothetical protein